MSAVIPKISEKTYALSQVRNTYVFAVPTSMNRVEVAKAVKQQYSVDVVSVNIAVQKGKKVRFISKGGRRVNTGVRADVKKAYVRLGAGQSIPVFAALSDNETNTEGKGPEERKKGK
jgi:large subunit ribosomal protein L23